MTSGSVLSRARAFVTLLLIRGPPSSSRSEVEEFISDPLEVLNTGGGYLGFSRYRLASDSMSLVLSAAPLDSLDGWTVTLVLLGMGNVRRRLGSGSKSDISLLLSSSSSLSRLSCWSFLSSANISREGLKFI